MSGVRVVEGVMGVEAGGVECRDSVEGCRGLWCMCVVMWWYLCMVCSVVVCSVVVCGV